MYKIISLSEARKLNITRYFTGKLCKRGHISERDTASATCIACKYLLDKKYYENNSTKIKEKEKIYRKNNPQKIRERFKKYYSKTKHEYALRRINWRKNNTEKTREKGRIYRATRRAAEISAEGRYTVEDFEAIKKAQGYKCLVCSNANRPLQADHIKALSKGGSNWPENIQALCGPCNLSKCDKDFDDFLREKGIVKSGAHPETDNKPDC